VLPKIYHINLKGFRCRYKFIEQPNQPVVILLAGALQEIETLDSITNLLDNYSVYVLELPGQGGADALDESYPSSFLASCLESFVTRYIHSDFNLIAYSYANIIAIDYLKTAMRQPSRTILAAGMAQLSDEQRTFIKGLIRLSPKDCVEAFVEFITSDKLESKQHTLLKRASIRYSLRYIKKYPLHFYNNTQRLLNHDIGDLSTIQSRCMTIAGELDPFVTPSLSKDLANKLKNCSHFTIEKTDHLFYLEQPETFKKLITTFFCEEYKPQSAFG